MVLKELSLTKYSLYIFCVFTLGCSHPKEQKAINIFENFGILKIPNDTILGNNTSLKLQNGVYYFGSNTFSGYIKSNYNSVTLKSIASFFQGKQHGVTKTFFPNGKLETERNYRNGLAYGRHFGYFQNEKMKFDFMYLNDKREGVQKQWYESGKKYYELTFTGDQENGMQKAWRENGKPFINYEVKDGERYGLQKAALCYTLKNEILK